MSAADEAADRELFCRLKVLLIKVGRGHQPTPKEMQALQLLHEMRKPKNAREN